MQEVPQGAMPAAPVPTAVVQQAQQEWSNLPQGGIGHNLYLHVYALVANLQLSHPVTCMQELPQGAVPASTPTATLQQECMIGLCTCTCCLHPIAVCCDWLHYVDKLFACTCTCRMGVMLRLEHLCPWVWLHPHNSRTMTHGINTGVRCCINIVHAGTAECSCTCYHDANCGLECEFGPEGLN